MSDSGIRLSEAIASLREELATAVREGEGHDVRFELGPVQLEVEVSVTKEAKADGGIRFWVLSAGASGSSGSLATTRLSLTLEPIVRGTRRPLVGSRRTTGTDAEGAGDAGR